MARKKLIPTNGFGDARELPKIETYKKKVIPYKEPQFLRDLRLNRERLFWVRYPEQRAEIEEYVNYMKSQWALQDKRNEKN